MDREEIDAYRQGQREPDKETVRSIMEYMFEKIDENENLTIEQIIDMYFKENM